LLEISDELLDPLTRTWYRDRLLDNYTLYMEYICKPKIINVATVWIVEVVLDFTY
jgi:hypothetical protein